MRRPAVPQDGCLAGEMLGALVSVAVCFRGVHSFAIAASACGVNIPHFDVEPPLVRYTNLAQRWLLFDLVLKIVRYILA